MLALEQHTRDKHSFEFGTQNSKNAHETFSGCNPANRVKRPTPVPSGWRPSSSGLRSSNAPQSTESVDEELPTSDVTECTDEGSDSESLASPSRSSDSTMDEGEMFHSTSEISPTDAVGEGATVERPYSCTHSLEPDTCSICRQMSSLSSNTDKPAPDDAATVVSTNDKHRDNSTDRCNAIFQCIPCLEVFETEGAFRDHVCAFRAVMFRPHCQICYAQFDDEPSLQKHLEGLQSFSCPLCPTRCCSDEMMQDHLLSHPTCGKCGKYFADNLALCAHLESDHPVVVCWDCNGIVVETASLELHYADSSAHPSCAFCGLGKRNSADMDEHVKHVHVTSAEPEYNPEGGNASSDGKSPSGETQHPGADRENAARQPLEGPDRTSPPPIVESTGPLGGPGDELHNSPLQTESSLSLPLQPPMPPQVEHVSEATANPCVINGEESPDAGLRQYASPSPPPSEHGSEQLHASGATNTAVNNDTRPPSPVSSVSAEPFSDTRFMSSLSFSIAI
ncbi:hypothetical protein J3R83DRAFT_10471 [Lanmaoa asiatica]|nr:hypothetical protein J3R83DRAFT_10471 [Lanmaoa asiatica]